jgi:hypothetical protein
VKTKLKFFAVGLAGCLGLTTFNASADLEVSATFSIRAEADFYEPLTPHGAWITVGSYGRCWRPARVAVGWRPYTHGHWVWTDCGWYWQSDEPWAWACYHYGYWVHDSFHGWIWIPGIEWGPAWVSWRVGGGYIGWAPLAPPLVTVTLGAPHFVFVKSARFQERHRPSRMIVNNATVINNTTVINNIRREDRQLGGARSQNVVINEGPGVEVVQKAAGRKIETVRIQEAARQTRAPAGLPKRSLESPGKGKSSVSPDGRPKADPSKPVPDVKPGKGKAPEYDYKRQPPERPGQRPATPPGKKGKDDSVGPRPNQPGSPGGPPAKSPKSKDKRGKGKPRDGEGRGGGKP